jgi:hypothetical protein
VSDETSKPFLSRWSQRKLAASREASARAQNTSVAPPVSTPPVPESAPAPPMAAESPAPELPPVESLSFDSDFTAFLQPKVDESVKRQALRKLFADPHFNVMDGLDVYIDDYTKFVPMTPEIVAQLNHAKFLFDPPKTRINAAGHAEDVPPEPDAVAEGNDAEVAEQPVIEAQASLDTPMEPLPQDAVVPAAETLPAGDVVSPAAKQDA